MYYVIFGSHLTSPIKSCSPFLWIRSYIKDAVAYCKQHGLVKNLWPQLACVPCTVHKLGYFHTRYIGACIHGHLQTCVLYKFMCMQTCAYAYACINMKYSPLTLWWLEERQVLREGVQVLCRVLRQGSNQTHEDRVGSTHFDWGGNL